MSAPRIPHGPLELGDAPGVGELDGVVEKRAYLGSFHEYSLATELGSIVVVSSDVQRVWSVGDAVSLRLAGHGFSVVAA